MSWCEATIATRPTIALAQYLRRCHLPKKTWRGRRCIDCGKAWRRHGCRDYLWATDYLSRLSKIILHDRPDRPKPGRHRPSYTEPLREYADIAEQHVAAEVARAAQEARATAPTGRHLRARASNAGAHAATSSTRDELNRQTSGSIQNLRRTRYTATGGYTGRASYAATDPNTSATTTSAVPTPRPAPNRPLAPDDDTYTPGRHRPRDPRLAPANDTYTPDRNHPRDRPLAPANDTYTPDQNHPHDRPLPLPDDTYTPDQNHPHDPRLAPASDTYTPDRNHPHDRETKTVASTHRATHETRVTLGQELAAALPALVHRPAPVPEPVLVHAPAPAGQTVPGRAPAPPDGTPPGHLNGPRSAAELRRDAARNPRKQTTPAHTPAAARSVRETTDVRASDPSPTGETRRHLSRDPRNANRSATPVRAAATNAFGVPAQWRLNT